MLKPEPREIPNTREVKVGELTLTVESNTRRLDPEIYGTRMLDNIFNRIVSARLPDGFDLMQISPFKDYASYLHGYGSLSESFSDPDDSETSQPSVFLGRGFYQVYPPQEFQKSEAAAKLSIFLAYWIHELAHLKMNVKSQHQFLDERAVNALGLSVLRDLIIAHPKISIYLTRREYLEIFEFAMKSYDLGDLKAEGRGVSQFARRILKKLNGREQEVQQTILEESIGNRLKVLGYSDSQIPSFFSKSRSHAESLNANYTDQLKILMFKSDKELKNIATSRGIFLVIV